jgi:hypothetical protein
MIDRTAAMRSVETRRMCNVACIETDGMEREIQRGGGKKEVGFGSVVQLAVVQHGGGGMDWYRRGKDKAKTQKKNVEDAG